MPLNYSKWDQLELSDDSDIEGHPNVDHKSLVRWKQRDIHEKRQVRNAKIAGLQAEIATNDVLLPRLRTITEDVHAAPDGPQYFSQLVERLQKEPSPEAPAKPQGGQSITYDDMILSLLRQITAEAKEKGVENNNERLREALIAGLKGHVAKLGEHQETIKKELADEEAEKHKKITSDDMKDGWDNKYVPPKPDPAPVPGVKPKGKTAEYEVLNPKAVEKTAAATSPSPMDYEDEDAELPQMTPNLTEFSKIPLRAYEQSFHYIQEHRDIYVPGASDALLVQAFSAQSEGKSAYAKQCIFQSLLLQYCEKLGKDGVRLFFKRMMSEDPRAEAVFLKDVEDTYAHLLARSKIAAEEAAAAGGEQIQLVPEHAGQQISFTIPDGPPPEHLRLEGPGTENLDVEEVRKALQMRWDVFQGFSKEFREALAAQSLEKVNKVLGAMSVEEAERTVGLLDNAGILNFAEGGIRDQTGGDEAEEGDDEEDADDEGEDGDDVE
ncbi:hypothetical protein BD410DRAFT_794026 [Rickenella mellea]|uniref:Hsp90 chaperone protein kinase-targeting subunit n=1 Tax=Rickenella mellea TaxID=50990 RepID=A0A4Y7PQL0_9AGAM|nr:hypothetical protein BD410DRAFT_794026 [Rickenella mellea]